MRITPYCMEKAHLTPYCVEKAHLTPYCMEKVRLTPYCMEKVHLTPYCMDTLHITPYCMEKVTGVVILCLGEMNTNNSKSIHNHISSFGTIAIKLYEYRCSF